MEQSYIDNFESGQIRGETFIESRKIDLKRVQAEIKALRTAKRGATKEVKARINAQIELKKADLQRYKEEIERFKTALKQREMQLVQDNPDLKRYILFEEGKVFDKKITEAKERKELIKIVANSLQNPNLYQIANEYAKEKADVEAKIEMAKNTPGITIDDEDALKQKLNDLRDKFEKKFKEIHKNDALGKNIGFEEVLKVIDGIPYTTDLSTSIINENLRISEKLAFREEQLAHIIRQGQEMNVKFYGYTNHTDIGNSTTRAMTTTAPAKRKWRYYIPIIGKRMEENDKNRAMLQRQQEEQARLDAMESYGPSEHKGYNFRDNLTVRQVIDGQLRESRRKVQNRDKEIDGR